MKTLKRTFQALSSLFAVFFLVLSGLFYVHPQKLVLAECGDGGTQAEKLAGCASEDGVGSTPDEQIDYLDEVTKRGDRDGSFAYIVSHILLPNYLNSVSYGTEGGPEPLLETPLFKDGESICSTSSPYAGTPLYHNCDIPNFSAEALQNLISLVWDQGLVGGDPTQAKTSELYLPSGFGGDGGIRVPVNGAYNQKFTGLELFGYNLNFTQYLGEWDQIHVDNSARLLTNFGSMDMLKTVANTTWNTVTSAVSGAFEGTADGWKNGGLIGAVGGYFTGAFDGGVEAFARSIVETTDLNVYRSWGWSRGSSYTKTLYGVRELTEDERAALLAKSFKDYMGENAPRAPAPPDDLADAKKITDPKTACVKKGGSSSGSGSSSTKTGSSSSGGKSASGEGFVLPKSSTLDEAVAPLTLGFILLPFAPDDGCGEGEELVEDFSSWPTDNAASLAANAKYLQCSVPGSAAEVPAYKSCILGKYDAKEDELTKQDAVKQMSLAVKNLLSGRNFSNYLKKHPEVNANAPFNRFICLNPDGTDMKDEGGNLVQVYNSDGSKNPACGNAPRQPIQNGLLGSGYSSTEQPPVDTRWERFNSLGSVLLASFSFSGLNDLLFGVAEQATKLSNAALKLSFSTNLTDLGLRTLIISLIETLSKSIFFPLLILGISISVLLVFLSTVRKQAYKQALIELAQILGVFLLGSILLTQPAKAFDFVEKAPAVFENVVMESVWETSSVSDTICDAGGAVNFFDVSATQRSMMCMNWLVFEANPWAFSQWGVSLDKLDASDFSNTNSSLVGSGTVKLGPNSSVDNWGVYQLAAMTRGSTTDYDSSSGRGGNPDLYRLVDLQFGPNNGAGTDDRYASTWADGGSLIVALLSGVLAVVGLLVVGTYSVGKIIITLVSTLLLLFLPIMLFVGLFKGSGYLKLKNYLGTIGGYIIQRFMLSFMLIVMFTMVVAAAQSTSHYSVYFIFTLAILLFFLKYRKTFLKWAMSLGVSGSSFGGGPEDAKGVAALIPTGARSTFNQFSGAVVGVASGVAASVATGNAFRKGGLVRDVKQSATAQGAKAYTAARRIGFGRAQSLVESVAAANSYVDKDNGKLERERITFEKSISGRLREKSLEAQYGSALEDAFFQLNPKQRQEFRRLRQTMTNTDGEILEMIGAKRVDAKVGANRSGVIKAKVLNPIIDSEWRNSEAVRTLDESKADGQDEVEEIRLRKQAKEDYDALLKELHPDTNVEERSGE